jgi:hypothetical protein
LRSEGPIARTATLLAGALLLTSCRQGEARSSEEAKRLMGHVRALASEIGPRPSGSSAEAKARQYIVQAFQQAGLQAREEAVVSLRLSERSDLVLNSANVVARREGRDPRAILIGAHHDSRSSHCPGASDDASGVAVLLEVARRMAARPTRHTLVFASFTGEETVGLPGSREFLRSWKGPPPMAALTLDFVGTGRLFVAPFPRPPELWANRLLARAEEVVRTRRVSFDPWLVIVPRLLGIPYGADHMSFLRAGIPSFNLSCEFPAWTYHTPDDVAHRVEAETLVAAAALVEEMARELDSRDAAAVPADRGYVPLAFGGFVAFLPELASRGVGIAMILLVGVTLLARRRECFTFPALSESIRGLVLAIPLTALAVSGGFAAEALLGFMSGSRRPWVAHPTAHLAGSLAAVGLTAWLATGIFRFIRPTSRGGVYLATAIASQVVLAGFLSAVDRHEIALPLWLGAAGMLAASRCERLSRAAACGILGAVWSLPYLSPTTLRMFLELSGFPVPPHALQVTVFVLAFPWFLFCLYLSCLPEILLARRPGALWSWPVGVTWLLLALALFTLNASRSTRLSSHRAVVEVRERVDAGERKVEATLSSLETLRGIRLQGWEAASLPDSARKGLTIPWERIHLPSLALGTEKATDEEIYRLAGNSVLPARLATLSVKSADSFEVFREGAWEATREYRRVFLPAPEGVREEIHVRREEGGPPLDLEAVLEYDEDLLGLRPQGKGQVFRFSSRLRLVRQFP